MSELLNRLIAKAEAVAKEREALIAKRNAIEEVMEQEAREELSPEETTEFNSLTTQIAEKDASSKDLEERIRPLNEERLRNPELTAGAIALRKAKQSVEVVREGLTYEKGAQRSFFADMAMVATNRDLSGICRGRLERHAREAELELRVDLNRTPGQGGDFVPPIWLMNEWIAFARPGRATANAVANHALPGGTNSINIPKIATGSVTAVQTADNAPVNQTDITDTFVQANVKTLAGQQSVALQLLEQSPVNFDQVVFSDMVADYNQRLDLQVLNGSGASGQVQGILGTTGIGTVTYSDTTQNAGTMYAAIANAIQLVHVNRFLPPSVIVMHPRRWAGLLAARDSQGRPLFLPGVQEGRNAMGVLDEVAAQGVVGNVQGLPVITDANVPTNLGAGTNQDVILVMRASDVVLYEGGIRTRALMETKGVNLEVVLQVYNYFAFTAARFPGSIAQVTGTGLTPPSFT